jgi:hypothetical protein
MATDIVGTLFGLPSSTNRQVVEETERNRDYNTGMQFGAAFGGDSKEVASQFALGGAIGRGIGGLFGFKTQDQKRAADFQTVMQETQKEIGSNDPAQLYPAMASKLEAMGYGEEALRVGQVGFAAKQSQQQAVGDLAYKQAMINYYQVLGANQKAAEETRLMEQRGQIAAGALTQIEGTEDSVVADKVWNATLEGLKAKGLDISSLADLPPAERAKALQGIIDSSETSATRTKAEIAQATLAMKTEQFAQKQALEQQKLDLKMAMANLQEQIAMMRVDSAERRAATSKVDSFSQQLQLLQIKEANDTQAGYASQIGTKEFNKDISSYLKETVGLTEKGQIDTARTEFNTVYRELLGRKTEGGLPLYNNIEALNRTKKYIEDKVGTEETFFGFGKPKPKFDAKSKATNKVIKLD